MKNVTLVALALSFALAACSDSNTGTVSFALTARQAAAPAGSAAFSSTAAAPAQLVLRKVELKRSDVASCDAARTRAWWRTISRTPSKRSKTTTTTVSKAEPA